MPATNTAAALLAFILACCTERLYTPNELYHRAIRTGLSTVKPEGGMTISHDEIERECYAAAIRGEMKRVYAALCGCDMFRTA